MLAVQIIYFISCFLCIITTSVIINVETNEGTKNLIAAMIAVTVRNCAYLLELTSTNPESSMICIKFEYLGSVFLLLFVAEYVCYYCKIQKPKYLFKVLAVLDLMLLVGVWTTEYTHLFYSDMIWNVADGHSYMRLKNGVLYYVYILCAVIIPSVYSVLIMYRYMKSRNTKAITKQVQCFIASILLPVCLFMCEAVLKKLEYNFTACVSGFFMCYIIFFVLHVYGEDINVLTNKMIRDSLGQAIVIVDYNGNVIQLNNTAKEIWGDIKGERLNKYFSDIKNFSDEEYSSIPIKDKIYECKIKPVIDKNDILQGHVVILFDITGLHNNMIELEEAKNQAEMANRAKTEFLSNVSHEIRTPMNSIIGIANIMLRDETVSHKKEYLMNIKNSGVALVGMINDILDYSKMESNKLELVCKEYNPIIMLNELSLTFLSCIRDKDIQLLYDIDKDLPAMIYGDELRIRQIIINIVNNAIKFTDRGYVKLSVSTRMEDDKFWLDISVKDTGIGIKEENIGKLFDSFQRLDIERNHSKEGTGLGLAICKRLVDKMNGTITVNSVYEIGTEFNISLEQGFVTPEKAIFINKKGKRVGCKFENKLLENSLCTLVERYGMVICDEDVDYFFTDIPDYADDSAILVGNPLKTDKADLYTPIYSYSLSKAFIRDNIVVNENYNDVYIAPNAKILIVDDNDMNLIVIKGILKPYKINIDTTSNGLDAIEKAEKHDYDMIFLDYMMPVLDGAETAKIMRKNGIETPIIALTATAIDEKRNEFMEAGMNGMLAKPINLDELMNTLRQYVNGYSLDIEYGIGNSAGVKEIYFSTIKNYVKSSRKSTSNILNYIAYDDYTGFTKEIQKLKSQTEIIGLHELADEFYSLEKAAKKLDIYILQNKVPDVLRDYTSCCNMLTEFVFKNSK